MKPLSDLINYALRQRALSLRQAAREIGISHTTLIRVMEGKPYDTGTLVKIASWMGVRPATLLNLEGETAFDPDRLADYLAAVIEANPDLQVVIREAIRKLGAGTLKPEVVQKMVQYAVYLLMPPGHA